jgi:hypothetical protein
MNHELLIYSYYPKAIRRRSRPDLARLVEAAPPRRRAGSRRFRPRRFVMLEKFT